MKTKTLFMSLFLVTALIGVSAAEDAMVYGQVYDGLSINHVPDADVTVVCEETTESAQTTSDSEGTYFTPIGFQCPDGSAVTVTAEKDGKTGTATGTLVSEEFCMDAEPTSCETVAYINIALVDVPIFAPEIAAFLAVATALAPGIGYMLVKKR